MEGLVADLKARMLLSSTKSCKESIFAGSPWFKLTTCHTAAWDKGQNIPYDVMIVCSFPYCMILVKVLIAPSGRSSLMNFSSSSFSSSSCSSSSFSSSFCTSLFGVAAQRVIPAFDFRQSFYAGFPSFRNPVRRLLQHAGDSVALS